MTVEPGIYRGGFGDLYRIEPKGFAGEHVRITNLTSETSSWLTREDVLLQIERGWLIKTSGEEQARETRV